MTKKSDKSKSTQLVKSSKAIPNGYKVFLEDLKKRIRSAQIKAAVCVNEELLKLYWGIGKDIAERQDKEGWGTQVIERLGKDIQNAFPGVEGFSRTNLFRMRAFYLAYEKIPQAVGQLEALPIFTIPWGHNMVIIERLNSTELRLWYAQKSIENGWTRSILEVMIKNAVHKRQGKAITNFKNTLPMAQSDLAQNTLKDPYIVDFITWSEDIRERDLENQLATNMQKFLIELGHGFAFVGKQYPIKAGKKDLYIDLLFYHLKLRCYVVVELKGKEFDSRDAGQMSAYLSAVDDQLRHKHDNPSIGIILCKTKDNVFAEYVLRNFNRPIGVAEFEVKLVEKLPKELKSSLPTIKEIEAELEDTTR